MPRLPHNSSFLAGYVHRVMEQLRGIVHQLDERRNFSEYEIGHIERSIMGIDADMKCQRRCIDNDSDLQKKMLEYDQLLKMAHRGLKEVQALNRDGAQPDSQSSPIQFGDVDMAEYDEPRRSVFARLDLQRDEDEQDTISLFASDCEAEIPVHRMSVIKSAPSYEPIKFSAPANPIKQATGASQRENVAGEDGLRQLARQEIERRHRREQSKVVSSKSQIVLNHRGEPVRIGPTASERSRSELDSNYGARSQSSFASYVSSAQRVHATPLTNITYPPILDKCPINMARNDPTLIGRSEIFTTKPREARLCPECTGHHKMYRCTTIIRAGLQERWYKALKAGVCLYCLRTGHSSFTCEDLGACYRCKTRHNSLLCPKNQRNLDPTL